MIDLYAAMLSTIKLFHQRGKFPDVKVIVPKGSRQFGYVEKFQRNDFLFPSMDFRPKFGIDTSFCFIDQENGAEALAIIRDDLVARFEAEFLKCRVKVLRRGKATSVVIVAYDRSQIENLTNNISGVIVRQFEHMLRVGADVLKQSADKLDVLSFTDIEDALDKKVRASARDPIARRARLKEKEKIREPPKKVIRSFIVFDRDPDVIAEALDQAKGKCQACGEMAPFSRLADGSPFLEVHHIKPLSKGGLDSLNNVEALCPNCHRDMHHGPRSRNT